MRFSIHTLGCKSNQYESQAMAKLLCQRGHLEVSGEESPDAFLINTCSVTAVSDKKSRQLIRSVRKQNPHTLIAVCGCYAQLEPEDLATLQVNLVGGTGDHLPLIQELEELYQQTTPTVPRIHKLPYNDPQMRLGIEPLPSGGLQGRTRALLKIQDGCENFCTYCIIPKARGKIRSLSPIDSAIAIGDLIEQGYQEIILTGIEISSWGKDLPCGDTLLDFLDSADTQVQGYYETERKQIFFRLGSLEPRTITEEFCSKAKDFTSLRPHFHLSLQSGSDTVLKRMNRSYDSQRFFESVNLLRKYFPNPAITTDLIVGFPQETEEEFSQTLAFVKKCQFSSMHIFPYSPRKGTPAGKMSGQISKEVKTARAKTVQALAREMTSQYETRFLGKTIPVLFEHQRLNQSGESQWTGLSPQHITVEVTSTFPLQNQTHLVQITSQTKSSDLSGLSGFSGLQGQLVSTKE